MESGTKLIDRDKLSEKLPQRYEEPLIRVDFGSNVRTKKMHNALFSYSKSQIKIKFKTMSDEGKESLLREVTSKQQRKGSKLPSNA